MFKCTPEIKKFCTSYCSACPHKAKEEAERERLEREQKTEQANGHEYVDLGLPSGTLWATCNVGASKPEDYGDYFAWGETKKKDVYDWDTSLLSTKKSKSFFEIVVKSVNSRDFEVKRI